MRKLNVNITDTPNKMVPQEEAEEAEEEEDTHT
jgi:hypothetical protein